MPPVRPCGVLWGGSLGTLEFIATRNLSLVGPLNGPLPSLRHSELWAPMKLVYHGVIMRIPNFGPALGHHRIYFGHLEVQGTEKLGAKSTPSPMTTSPTLLYRLLCVGYNFSSGASSKHSGPPNLYSPHHLRCIKSFKGASYEYPRSSSSWSLAEATTTIGLDYKQVMSTFSGPWGFAKVRG